MSGVGGARALPPLRTVLGRVDPLVEPHVRASCNSRTRYVVSCQEQSLSLSRCPLDKIDTSNDTQQTLERGVQHKNEPGGRERGLEPGPSNACLPSYLLTIADETAIQPRLRPPRQKQPLGPRAYAGDGPRQALGVWLVLDRMSRKASMSYISRLTQLAE